jgi:hypothetical protein
MSGSRLMVTLARSASLTVELFTMRGARLATVVRQGHMPAGAYQLDLGPHLSADGQYLARVRIDSRTHVVPVLPGQSSARSMVGTPTGAVLNQLSGAVDTLTFQRQGFAFQRRAIAGYSGQIDVALHPIAAPQGVSATDGVSLDTVTILWRPSAGATGYQVARQRIGDTTITLLPTVADTAQADTTVGPGPFRYRVIAIYGDGQQSGASAWDAGHRRVTNREFLIEYNNTTIYSSQQKLPLLRSQSLGVDSARGDSSGTVRYNAAFNAGTLRATVTLAYTNYRDDYLTVNGTYTTSVNIAGTGTLTGPITVAGIYSGTVEYALTITSRNPSGGYYRVTQTGGASEDITYQSVSSELLR